MGRENRWKDSFGVVLVMLGFSMLAMAVLGEEYRGNEIAVLIQAIAVLITYRAAHVHGPRFLVVVVTAAVAVLGTGIAGVFGGAPSTLASGISLLILLALLPGVIAGRMRTYDQVDMRTVYAALCIYLIVGMMFSVLYLLIDGVTAQPFFAQPVEPDATLTLYFSFTTLTTLGFGDLSPISDLGRMLTITEALIGQVYLVTVVAMIVANLGRKREKAATRTASQEDVAPMD